MNGLVLLLALAAPGVDYGWRAGDRGEVECVIQLEPELVSALLKGDAERTVVRDDSPNSIRPTRFLVQVGDARLPQEDLAAATSPLRYAANPPALASPPKTTNLKHGWRLTQRGEVECVVHMTRQLASAILDGAVEPAAGGGEFPETGRDTRFVVYVTDQPLPRDLMTASDLLAELRRTPPVGSEFAAAATGLGAPRVLQLSHQEVGPLGGMTAESGRTVFETQLQLRRGEADLRFESETPAPSLRDQWTDRGARAGVSSTVGDTASRFGAAGGLSDSSAPSRYGAGGSRFGGGATTPLEAPGPPSNRLQIRYGDSDTQNTTSNASPSRYDAAAAGEPYVSAPAPPALQPSTYAAQPTTRPPAETPRTTLAPIGSGGGYTPQNRMPPPPGQQFARETDPYPTRPYQRQPAYDPNQVAYDANRIASRGGYEGPFRNEVAQAAPGGSARNAEKGDQEKGDPGKNDDKGKDSENEKTTLEAEPQWGPLVMTFFALLLSLSGNAYLGHMAWGIYRRYRSMTEDMRSSPDFASSSYDEEEGGSSGGRRRRRGRLAARY